MRNNGVGYCLIAAWHWTASWMIDPSKREFGENRDSKNIFSICEPNFAIAKTLISSSHEYIAAVNNDMRTYLRMICKGREVVHCNRFSVPRIKDFKRSEMRLQIDFARRVIRNSVPAKSKCHKISKYSQVRCRGFYV